MRKKLVIYLMSGDDAPELAVAAKEGGADIVELGFPFSDPLGEGPVIRQASERALARGMRTDRCLECLADVRSAVGQLPLVPMTYAALLEAYGYERFVADAQQAGATSFIIVDLPAEEHEELRRIQLVAPTSSDERIRIATAATDGWLYVVAVTGTTGVRDGLSPELPPLARRVRAIEEDVLLFAGFGIATPAQARATSAHVDGIVIGSRAVEVSREGPEALYRYVTEMRQAVETRAFSNDRSSGGPNTFRASMEGERK